jgi:hypothetical protein
MVSRQVFLAVLVAYFASAVPLNINLGAYSPALVVGDGEISFGSPEKASELLQTLSSGAENGAVAAGTAPREPEQAGTGTTANPALATASQMPAVAAAPAQASASSLASPLVAGSTVADINTNAITVGSSRDPSNTMPAEFISHKLDAPVEKYPVIDIRGRKRSLPIDDIDTHSAPMVSANAPSEPMAYRYTASDAAPKEPMAYKLKRDIDGFREALQFARDAQKNQPKVVLGQGITQFPGSAVPVNSAANGALPQGRAAVAKREVGLEEEGEGEKLGMTLIAIGEI